VPQFLGEQDVYLFNEGTHHRMYEHLGAHIVGEGTHFGVWAPNARRVAVIGDFNDWTPDAGDLYPSESGIWRGHLAGAAKGHTYKYFLETAGNAVIEKADPYAFHGEVPPKSASVVWDLDYRWGDAEWMKRRAAATAHTRPMAIYEMHVGSWRKKSRVESYSYRELAPLLVDYLTDLGFTHVELLPVTEHPYFPSWGYQATGYYAPTSRFGTPQDFMYLVDQLHQAGIGVILDWVPSHFATDPHGLGLFDGTHLYEHADPRLGWHPDWNSAIFNYGRNEVRSFLLSSAMFWLDRYHVDGLRVDAVASMLYLDYSRAAGEWIPNVHGGNENLEAIAFLRDLNSAAYGEMPGVVTVAEESTAWPGVSRPVDAGGLGFGFKWDMGWMHDTLSYFQHDPIHRAYHQNELTFRGLYQYDENFVLSLSHDEVVHGKGSLVNKMPGDEWQQFANLRALLAYMWALPGKKLLFMGCEFGQRSEWSVDRGLDWWVLEHPNHTGIQRLVSDLNALYTAEPALWAMDYHKEGFAWVDAGDAAASVLSWLRTDGGDTMLAVVNLTPLARKAYRVGVDGGAWEVVLNTDAKAYWGSGAGSTGTVEAQPEPTHGRSHSVALDLPPLGVLYLKAVDLKAVV
jgi:1,4-alpha-glucan branching enzyme